MDDNSVQKVWERPWSTEEMRSQCSNWNLAGDAGLLKHIQEFSQNLMQKTHTAELALDSLLEDMRNTSVDVQNATNALLMLSNNQFVENRVYDDCEDEKEEGGVESKGGEGDMSSAGVGASGENSLVAKAAEAILLGMSVIDTQFDCVEVPASDSEGEEDGGISMLQDCCREKSFALVLEPRNPYLVQPLPHLIGSKEFMQDDTVGLGGHDEDEEEDEEDEDVHLSIGQDLVAQGLEGNESDSLLTGDIVDEGLFDEDEADQIQRTPKKSSCSSGSDDLEVENKVLRKKQKKSKMMDGDSNSIDPFGPVGRDIFGGKESSSEDEFIGDVHTNGGSSVMEKRRPVDMGLNSEEVTIPAVEGSKNNSGEFMKKKINDANVCKDASKTPSVPSSKLFGPPKDDWKDDDEDMDSIFAASEGIFSGGRVIFDDPNEPVITTNHTDTNKLPSANLSDEPTVHRTEGGQNDRARRGNIFGDDDSEDDVFANILVKTKPPKEQRTKVDHEEVARKQQDLSEHGQIGPFKVRTDDSSDSWLFEEEHLDDHMWNIDVTSREDKRNANDKIGEPVMHKDTANIPQADEKLGKRKSTAALPKLPVGVQSFYADGIDSLALGKKLTKELEDKRKFKQESDDDNSWKIEAGNKKVILETASGLPEKHFPGLSDKSLKESNHSPDTVSLFDELDEGDDLFVQSATKADKNKAVASAGSDDFLEGSLFGHKKISAPTNKAGITNRLSQKKAVTGDAEGSKNVFSDNVSDDDGNDIFAINPSVSQLSASRVAANKGRKLVIDPIDPLFDVDFFTEDMLKDNLFSSLPNKKEVTNKRSIKKEATDSIKNEHETTTNVQTKIEKSATAKKTNELHRSGASGGPSAPVGDFTTHCWQDGLGISQGSDAPHSNSIPTPHKMDDRDGDDIFGDSLSGSGSDRNALNVPFDVSLSTGFQAGRVKQKPFRKSEGFKNLFDDIESDDDNFLSGRGSSDGESAPALHHARSEECRFLTGKKVSRDNFSEVDNDQDEQTLGVQGEVMAKVEHVFVDPLSQDDDLFACRKPGVPNSNIPASDNESSGAHSLENGKRMTEHCMDGDDGKGHLKGYIMSSEAEHSPVDNGITPQSSNIGSGTRRCPPKTLNLEKIIPSPKLDSSVVNLSDDIFGSNETEDDGIVEAWMKGRPPPLRDSRVETAAVDEVTPDYPTTYSYQEFGDSKSKISNDQGSSYFADIPTATLLHSHGKERARIQGHRRPPSRKVRRSSVGGIATPLSAVEAMTTTSAHPEAHSAATPLALPHSRTPMEEEEDGGGSQEEWSTPDAALTSPPHTVPGDPHRSNPLSPSTDEEQDFFDVLPVGPVLDPPRPPEFLDAQSLEVPADDVWDKEDGALFEDTQQVEQRSAWVSSSEPSRDGGGCSGWVQTDAIPSWDGSKGSNSKQMGGLGDASDDDLFCEVGSISAAEAPKSEGKTVTDQVGSLTKKVDKVRVKQESGKSDDLWGSGFGSQLKGDIFSGDSTGTNNFDDLFQGQGDLFGQSTAMSSTQETKKVTIGNVNDKSMGRSLSKLTSNSKEPVSLFGDEDDTGDLFSSQSSQLGPRKGFSVVKKPFSSRSTVSEQTAKSSLVKVAADDSIFEDPLMVLKRK